MIEEAISTYYNTRELNRNCS